MKRLGAAQTHKSCQADIAAWQGGEWNLARRVQYWKEWNLWSWLAFSLVHLAQCRILWLAVAVHECRRRAFLLPGAKRWRYAIHWASAKAVALCLPPACPWASRSSLRSLLTGGDENWGRAHLHANNMFFPEWFWKFLYHGKCGEGRGSPYMPNGTLYKPLSHGALLLGTSVLLFSSPLAFWIFCCRIGANMGSRSGQTEDHQFWLYDKSRMLFERVRIFGRIYNSSNCLCFKSSSLLKTKQNSEVRPIKSSGNMCHLIIIEAKQVWAWSSVWMGGPLRTPYDSSRICIKIMS